MTRVLLLGENGMLGSMVKKVLLDQGIEVVSTQKTGGVNASIAFDAMSDDPMALLSSQEAFTHVVNAIGIIKPRINEADNGSRVTAIGVNGLFPHRLASACEQSGVKVIQIATDCVYSGTVGLYGESAPHDPTDVYGKSKSLGEVPSPNVMHLRASIIGPEVGRQTSLWEWVRSQAPGAEINGFTNHLWNGVTTYHFGRICAGVITSGEFHSGTYHVVPGDIVTKAALVTDIAHASGRADIRINHVEAKDTIDRTLSTEKPLLNENFWMWAGYKTPPTISQMVSETPL